MFLLILLNFTDKLISKREFYSSGSQLIDIGLFAKAELLNSGVQIGSINRLRLLTFLVEKVELLFWRILSVGHAKVQLLLSHVIDIDHLLIIIAIQPVVIFIITTIQIVVLKVAYKSVSTFDKVKGGDIQFLRLLLRWLPFSSRGFPDCLFST